MELEFVGAAQTVTGSKHVLRTAHATILLDCGLFQGHRQESFEKNRALGVDPAGIDAVVLSHAHIDHSGALPNLTRLGYRGPIYTTSATRDLCAAMLLDAAMIQKSDARYINRQIERGQKDLDPVEPLYDEQDVLDVLSNMVALPYHRALPIGPGVQLTFLDAGHVLGSGIVCLDVEEGGTTRRLVFTGDLGRRHMPILRDPEIPEGTHLLLIESTYGDRLHSPIEKADDELAEVIKRVSERGGKLVIPSFALERAQEIVYALKTLRGEGRLPPIPVYVDSPLAVKLTDVFKLHPEYLDEEARSMVEDRDSPFEFPELRYVQSVEDSKRVTASTDPAIVISASGMCEAGRILHHLRGTVSDPKNAIMIVGFQAPHTLGRRIVEKRDQLRIFGVMHDRRAEVVVMNGFSAHADQQDLRDFAAAARDRGAVERVMLVHGEPKPQQVLAGLLAEDGFGRIDIPGPGDRLEL